MLSDLQEDIEKKEEEIPLFPSNMRIDFGVVALGSNESEGFVVSNPRSTPLELSAEIVGVDAAFFEFTLGDGLGSTTTIPAGASLGVEVRFFADQLGMRTATLFLHAGGQHGEVALVGASAAYGRGSIVSRKAWIWGPS